MDFVLAKLKSLINKFSFISGNTKDSFNDNRQLHLHFHLPNEGEIPKEQITEATKITQKILAQGKGFLVVTPQSQANLQLIDKYSKKDKDIELREFIQKKLPQRDRSIWYSALILREQFSKGNKNEVNRLKTEMSISNPGRGGNIANLCSTGYLESHIIPLYKFLVDEKGKEQLFLKIYETIITEFPFAVFVSQEKSLKDLHNEVKTKIDMVKKYGWEKVSVHGIGEDNVKKIMKITMEIQKENKDLKSIDISSFESQGKIVTVAFNLQ